MAKAKICAVEGCGKPHKGHGYCAKHLRALRRTGSPTGSRRYAERGETLPYLLQHMHDDCPKWPYARGRGGYGRVQYEGRVVDVHRLVCELVHGPAPSLDHDAAHSCGKGAEGCFGASCIEWKSKSENQADRFIHGTACTGEDAYQCKLTDAQVIDIRRNPRKLLQRELADIYGVSRSYISQLQGRRRRTQP